MPLKQKPKPNRLLIVFLVLLLSNSALANPIIIPDFSIGTIMVTLSTIGLESAITAIALFCLGMAPVPVVFAMCFFNMFTFGFMVYGIMEIISNVFVIEAMIITIEAVFIKIISIFDVFQWETFQGIRWRGAFIVSVLGNIASYFVGNVLIDKL